MTLYCSHAVLSGSSQFSFTQPQYSSHSPEHPLEQSVNAASTASEIEMSHADSIVSLLYPSGIPILVARQHGAFFAPPGRHPGRWFLMHFGRLLALRVQASSAAWQQMTPARTRTVTIANFILG